MLSIIIVCLNEEFTVSNILNDLKQQTVNDFEVIVVDSNSDDNTVAVVKKFTNDFEQFNIIENKERGLSPERNIGADAAQYERLLFLDSDTRLNVDFIEKVLGIINSKNIDVAGVYMDMTVGSFADRIVIFMINITLWCAKFIFPSVIGACIISTRTAHRSIGGFNQEIVTEDGEYAVKANKNKSIKFKMIPLTFKFDMRRFEQEGHFKLLFKFAMINIRRYFIGEYKKDEIEYKLGHHSNKNK